MTGNTDRLRDRRSAKWDNQTLCPSCFKSFDNLGDWRIHYQDEHPIASRMVALLSVIR